MKTRIFTITLVIILCFACVTVFGLPSMIDENVAQNKGQISWEKGTITVIGRGVAKQDANPAAMPILAERAAVAVAQRNALEVVEGVRVHSSTYVKDMELESDEIRTEVEGMLKGSQLGSSTYSGGVCTVSLFVPIGTLTSLVMDEMKGVSSLSSVSTPSEVAPDITPDNDNNVTPAIYTGLIIDARNFGVKGALAPQVFEADTNLLVYGPNMVKVDKSVVIYSRSVEKAKVDNIERLGNNPLIVKAVGAIKVKGEATDVIISSDDSKTFRQSKNRDEICANAAVAIIIN
ncbi:MAG TPA: hypothetical protein DDW50_21695 [Firmicutes bacterium]|jgi:hypothetical protein|nr:hypothetical protein [Bacillota bacterium]